MNINFKKIFHDNSYNMKAVNSIVANKEKGERRYYSGTIGNRPVTWCKALFTDAFPRFFQRIGLIWNVVFHRKAFDAAVQEIEKRQNTFTDGDIYFHDQIQDVANKTLAITEKFDDVTKQNLNHFDAKIANLGDKIAEIDKKLAGAKSPKVAQQLEWDKARLESSLIRCHKAKLEKATELKEALVQQLMATRVDIETEHKKVGNLTKQEVKLGKDKQKNFKALEVAIQNHNAKKEVLAQTKLNLESEKEKAAQKKQDLENARIELESLPELGENPESRGPALKEKLKNAEKNLAELRKTHESENGNQLGVLSLYVKEIGEVQQTIDKDKGELEKVTTDLSNESSKLEQIQTKHRSLDDAKRFFNKVSYELSLIDPKNKIKKFETRKSELEKNLKALETKRDEAIKNRDELTKKIETDEKLKNLGQEIEKSQTQVELLRKESQQLPRDIEKYKGEVEQRKQAAEKHELAKTASELAQTLVSNCKEYVQLLTNEEGQLALDEQELTNKDQDFANEILRLQGDIEAANQRLTQLEEKWQRDLETLDNLEVQVDRDIEFSEDLSEVVEETIDLEEPVEKTKTESIDLEEKRKSIEVPESKPGSFKKETGSQETELDKTQEIIEIIEEIKVVQKETPKKKKTTLSFGERLLVYIKSYKAWEQKLDAIIKAKALNAEALKTPGEEREELQEEQLKLEEEYNDLVKQGEELKNDHIVKEFKILQKMDTAPYPLVSTKNIAASAKKNDGFYKGAIEPVLNVVASFAVEEGTKPHTKVAEWKKKFDDVQGKHPLTESPLVTDLPILQDPVLMMRVLDGLDKRKEVIKGVHDYMKTQGVKGLLKKLSELKFPEKEFQIPFEKLARPGNSPEELQELEAEFKLLKQDEEFKSTDTNILAMLDKELFADLSDLEKELLKSIVLEKLLKEIQMLAQKGESGERVKKLLESFPKEVQGWDPRFQGALLGGSLATSRIMGAYLDRLKKNGFADPVNQKLMGLVGKFIEGIDESKGKLKLLALGKALGIRHVAIKKTINGKIDEAAKENPFVKENINFFYLLSEVGADLIDEAAANHDLAKHMKPVIEASEMLKKVQTYTAELRKIQAEISKKDAEIVKKTNEKATLVNGKNAEEQKKIANKLAPLDQALLKLKGEKDQLEIKLNNEDKELCKPEKLAKLEKQIQQDIGKLMPAGFKVMKDFLGEADGKPKYQAWLGGVQKILDKITFPENWLETNVVDWAQKSVIQHLK